MDSKELLESCKNADGSLNADKLASVMDRQQKELERVIKESTTRKEKLRNTDETIASKEAEIEAREKKLKEAEEVKLKETEQFQKLLAMKEAEIEKYKGLETKIKELEGYKNSIKERAAKTLEEKIAGLSGKELELYESASAGMNEEAYEQKIAFVDKLTTKTETPPAGTPPSGGRDSNGGTNYNDPETLHSLKNSNPELYKTVIREKMTATAKQ